MNFAKNRTLFPKMHKLGTSSLKQVCILFSSRKIYEAGPMSGGATLLRSSPDASSWCTLGIPSNERSDVATIQGIPASWISG